MSLPQADFCSRAKRRGSKPCASACSAPRRMAESTASGRLPVPPACSSAAPGTCVKQAEKSASIKEASYKVSYSAELSPSSSSAASVPTAA